MKNLKNKIEEVAEEMKTLRREIHQRPEPAFEEWETAAILLRRLKTIPGMRIQEGVAKTGIVATLGEQKDGDCLALRADMDCLRMQEENECDYKSEKKGLMHGCGHDGHSVCLLGAALVLGEYQDRLSGPVKFIFQPAEENYGGGDFMVREGVLQDPDVKTIFGLHGTPSIPLGHIGVKAGPVMAASRYFKITVRGKGAHAAMPQLGIDPVVIGSAIVCAVQSIVARNLDPLEAGLISIPQFTGSTAPNVIPEKVVLQGTLRALSSTTRDLLQERLKEVVENVAKGYGGTADVVFDKGYPVLINDPGYVEYFSSVSQKIVGEKRLDTFFPPTLGAEDFAFYLQEVPGVFWWLGLQEKGKENYPLHHPRFDFNDNAIPLAMEMHCRLALNFR